MMKEKETNTKLINDLKERWIRIKEEADEAAIRCGRNPDALQIIAVSKNQPPEVIIAAIQAGINTFGENYVQEFKEKFEYVQNNSNNKPSWHYIGHLQTNKVKYIVPFVDMIQTVDSGKLAEEISRQAAKSSSKIDILLQVNTSGEDSKSGCEPDDTLYLVENLIKFDNLVLKGLMTIGTFTDDEAQQRKEFGLLRNILNKVNNNYPELNLKELSMGMTHDFQVAIEEGATIVRIGTAIFGERNYN
jgi:PLP dependent protein